MSDQSDTSSPPATTEPGLEYFKSQMQSLQEMVILRLENPEEDHDLIINEWCLSAQAIRQGEEITDYDEETGEEFTIFTGMDIIEGHKFLLTWGGPEAWIISNDNGQTFTYHYCDWYGSDAFSCPILGENFENVNIAFEIYFECLEAHEKAGAVVEQVF